MVPLAAIILCSAGCAWPDTNAAPRACVAAIEKRIVTAVEEVMEIRGLLLVVKATVKRNGESRNLFILLQAGHQLLGFDIKSFEKWSVRPRYDELPFGQVSRYGTLARVVAAYAQIRKPGFDPRSVEG